MWWLWCLEVSLKNATFKRFFTLSQRKLCDILCVFVGGEGWQGWWEAREHRLTQVKDARRLQKAWSIVGPGGSAGLGLGKVLTSTEPGPSLHSKREGGAAASQLQFDNSRRTLGLGFLLPGQAGVFVGSFLPLSHWILLERAGQGSWQNQLYMSTLGTQPNPAPKGMILVTRDGHEFCTRTRFRSEQAE